MKSFFKYFFNLEAVQYSISFILYLYLQLVYHTSTKKIIFEENFEQKKFLNDSAIYVFWHNRLALMPFTRPPKLKINVLISTHRDGRVIAQVMKRFNFNIITGSSNKNSYSALKTIIKHINLGESIAITPDGPKGPKNQINSNVIAISSLCKKYIVPVTYSCARGIIFNSWDRFILPTPFNKIVIAYGTPIKTERNLNDTQITELNNLLASNLNLITNKADRITKLHT